MWWRPRRPQLSARPPPHCCDHGSTLFDVIEGGRVMMRTIVLVMMRTIVLVMMRTLVVVVMMVRMRMVTKTMIMGGAKD
jgi:hypothetical protein